ncbi:Signal transduction response regulator, receiver domain, partial [Dillenia turbinata]
DVHVKLVITDYNMPRIKGYKLLKKIKESTSLKDGEVMIMSSQNKPKRIKSDGEFVADVWTMGQKSSETSSAIRCEQA